MVKDIVPNYNNDQYSPFPTNIVDWSFSQIIFSSTTLVSPSRKRQLWLPMIEWSLLFSQHRKKSCFLKSPNASQNPVKSPFEQPNTIILHTPLFVVILFRIHYPSLFDYMWDTGKRALKKTMIYVFSIKNKKISFKEKIETRKKIDWENLNLYANNIVS